MLNAMGMMVGLVLARQRKVENPLLPALVAGMVPMPLGVIAAVLLTDSAPKEAPVTPLPPTKPWFEQHRDAYKAYQDAKDPVEKDRRREELFVMQAQRFAIPVNEVTRSFHMSLLDKLAQVELPVAAPTATEAPAAAAPAQLGAGSADPTKQRGAKQSD